MQHSLVTGSGLTDSSSSHDIPSNFPSLIVLLAGAPVPSVSAKYGSYHQIFCQLFRNTLSSSDQSSSQVPERGIQVKSFDSVAEEFPNEDHLSSAVGLLVTGSAASAYEDAAWIRRLTDFCSRLPESHPHLKLFGICFGHQIFAQAFGSTVTKNPLGWEVGVRDVVLSEIGKRLMDVNLSGVIRLHQLHQDHVESVPRCCFSIGSTPSCAIHGLVRYPAHVDPTGSEDLKDIQVLTVQGHPEFNPDIISKVIEAREQSKVFSKSLAEESRKYAEMHDDGIQFGELMLKIMGI